MLQVYEGSVHAPCHQAGAGQAIDPGEEDVLLELKRSR